MLCLMASTSAPCGSAKQAAHTYDENGSISVQTAVRLSGNSDRPQTGPLQVGNKRPRSAIFGHCAPSMTTAEKPFGYFPDSLSETVWKIAISGETTLIYG